MKNTRKTSVITNKYDLSKILPENYFITATDTDVGKTFVASLLGKYYRSKGYITGAMKPIASGDRSDAILLKEKLALTDSIETINPVLFDLPLAPYSCFLENKGDLPTKEKAIEKILNKYDFLKKKYEIVLVEGIGGLLVPLWDKYYLVDLISLFKIPVLIVAKAGLGTINHTLLTVESLKKRKIPIYGIILNGFSGKDISENTNKIVIEKFAGIPVLATIPYMRL